MNKLFKEDEEEDLRYIKAIKKVTREAPEDKKEMMKFIYNKMVRQESPYRAIYLEIKKIQKYSIQELAEKSKRINQRNRNTEDEDINDYDETPEDIINKMQNNDLKEYAQWFLNHMRKDNAPIQAQIEYMKDIYNGVLPFMPQDLKRQQDHQNRTKRNMQKEASTKVEPKKETERILKKLPGYTSKPADAFKEKVEDYLKKPKNKPSKKEKDLYKGFEDIK